MIIDAHHHLWNIERTPQPWMTAEHDAIARTFAPADLEPILTAYGITRTVLVQGACFDDDTDYLFEVADRHAWIGAVTAWVALDDPERVSRPAHGARHAAEAPRNSPSHPRRARSALDRSARRAGGHRARRGRGAGARAARRLPAPLRRRRRARAQLPPAAESSSTISASRRSDRPRWPTGRPRCVACAAHPNVVAKISGLNTAITRSDWSASDLRRPIEVAVDCFGSDRLMWGSDWPVSLLNGEL